MFVGPRSTAAALLHTAQSIQGLNVRTVVVRMWAEHLARVYPAYQADPARLALDRSPDGPLRALLQAALHVDDPEDADALLQAFSAGREGYARTRHGVCVCVTRPMAPPR